MEGFILRNNRKVKKGRIDFLPNRANKYSIRRFTVGTASILIGATLIFGTGQETKAAEETNTTPQSEATNDSLATDSSDETNTTPQQTEENSTEPQTTEQQTAEQPTQEQGTDKEVTTEQPVDGVQPTDGDKTGEVPTEQSTVEDPTDKQPAGETDTVGQLEQQPDVTGEEEQFPEEELPSAESYFTSDYDQLTSADDKSAYTKQYLLDNSTLTADEVDNKLNELNIDFENATSNDVFASLLQNFSNETKNIVQKLYK